MQHFDRLSPRQKTASIKRRVNPSAQRVEPMEMRDLIIYFLVLARRTALKIKATVKNIAP